MRLLQEGLGRGAGSEGGGRERQEGPLSRQVRERAAGRQRVCYKRKGDQGKEKQKQPINSPEGKGRARSRGVYGICAKVGHEARPPLLSATDVLSRNRWDVDSRPPVSPSHTAGQVLTTEHPGQADIQTPGHERNPHNGEPEPPLGPGQELGSPVG